MPVKAVWPLVFPRARSLTGGLAAWDTEVGHLALPLPIEKSGE
jgi:hypothetical protein